MRTKRLVCPACGLNGRFLAVGVFVIGLSLANIGQARAQRMLAIPQPGAVSVSTLTSEATDADGLVLTLLGNQSVAMRRNQQLQQQFWVLNPSGRNTFRMQLFEGGKFWSLAANGPQNRITLNPSAQSSEQLWRVIPSLAVPGAIRLESIAFPGRFLTGALNSSVTLASGDGSPEQNWFVDETPPPPTIVIPAIEMVQHEVRGQPELPPAKTTLVNSQNNELWIVIADLRGGPEQHIKIPPRGSVDVELERDAGATIVESYQVTNAFGQVFREEFVTAIPPATLYDITVYERFLQSIAIDRTGKSPNKIEDVNYQPKSVGIIPVPPGDQFRGGPVDVYQSAKRRNNAGGVRPIRPEDWEPKEKTEDPVERALREAQGN